MLRNDDPIGHELIVGPPAVHDRHRHGTEAAHEPRDGELSVGPDGQGVTTYVFDEPGVVEMACHLPGHYAFGMHGRIEVVEPRRETVCGCYGPFLTDASVRLIVEERTHGCRRVVEHRRPATRSTG